MYAQFKHRARGSAYFRQLFLKPRNFEGKNMDLQLIEILAGIVWVLQALIFGFAGDTRLCGFFGPFVACLFAGPAAAFIIIYTAERRPDLRHK